MRKPTEFRVPFQAGSVAATAYHAAEEPIGALVLAHGAGAGHRSPFIVNFAHALAAAHVDVVTFNFPYVEYGRRLPDRPPVLDACYRAVVDAIPEQLASARGALFIGGKSMGGRIATQLAAADPELPIRGIVLLGYPLHPPGRPHQRRDAHLPSIVQPVMFVQGTRDAFGTPGELAAVVTALDGRATVFVVQGGDHSFKVAGAGASQRAIYAEVQQAIARWMGDVVNRP